jgi:hypothetical protein
VETLVANCRLFRIAPKRQFAMTALAVAAFALLCAGCTTASADCRDDVAAAFERLTTSGRPITDPRPRRLLILACSATKRHDPDPIPARDRYDDGSGGRCAPPIRSAIWLVSASSRRGSASGTHRRPSRIMTRGSARIYARIIACGPTVHVGKRMSMPPGSVLDRARGRQTSGGLHARA